MPLRMVHMRDHIEQRPEIMRELRPCKLKNYGKDKLVA